MCLDSTVFLIDDDAAVRDALSISLSMSGLKIEVYSSVEAFLDIYNENRPGCLLINLSQPDMGGLAVQQELIRRNFFIPIIYMTEIGSIRNSVSAVQYGVFCFLEKPFPRSLLLESIREAMEQDCGKRSAIKNQVETHNKSADPQSCYKRISPREGAIMALIMLGKSSKPIAGMLKHTLKLSLANKVIFLNRVRQIARFLMRKHSVISKNQWQYFCDNYTRQHWGLVVKVDAYDPTLAKLYCEAPPPRLKTMANNLVFQGIVFEDSSFRLELLICLASGEGLFTHRVMHPTIILVLWTDVGLHEGITIHDKCGGLIHIRFHEPASPELSDNWMGLGSRNRKHIFRLADSMI